MRSAPLRGRDILYLLPFFSARCAQSPISSRCSATHCSNAVGSRGSTAVTVGAPKIPDTIRCAIEEPSPRPNPSFMLWPSVGAAAAGTTELTFDWGAGRKEGRDFVLGGGARGIFGTPKCFFGSVSSFLCVGSLLLLLNTRRRRRGGLPTSWHQHGRARRCTLRRLEHRRSRHRVMCW